VREGAVGREVVDELFEREPLVRQRIGRGVPDPAEQHGEARIVGERRSQQDGVREQPDNRVELGVGAASCLGGDHQVGLARVARQHDREAGEERHEHGGVGGLGHLGQACDRRVVDGDAGARAARGLAGGPGPGSGQGQDVRCAFELFAPVAQLALKLLAAHPVVLPHGVIAITHPQRR